MMTPQDRRDARINSEMRRRFAKGGGSDGAGVFFLILVVVAVLAWVLFSLAKPM